MDGATNGARFLSHVTDVLVPTLKPGDTVVMDNLSVHHSNAAIERIDELGFEYIFTPPYSPDANPIESVFSIFKGQLRKERIGGIIHGRQVQLPPLIERIWWQLDRQKIINCIVHVLKYLKI